MQNLKSNTKKKNYSQDIINLEIKKDKTNIIKLDNEDELNEDNNDAICGVNDDFENLGIKHKKAKNKNICNKCKLAKSCYYVRNEFVCQPCFFKNINHKFRSNLRVNCKIRHEDTVLVCISGGINSIALAHWFNITFNDNTSNKKLFFKLKFLHVDNTFLKQKYFNFEDSKKEVLLAERKQKNIILDELFKKYNFEYDVINLENVLDIESLNLIDIYDENLKDDNKKRLRETNFSLIDRYLKIYEKISKAGSFETDFNKILTKNIIFYYSRLNMFNKIIFGNNGQSLVSSAFASIIKGRGLTTKEDIAYVDSRYFKGNPLILRPLKDFLDKEILLFNYMNKIDAIPDAIDIDFIRFNHKNNIPFKGNTDNLVQSFFDNLQNRMGSTITTVLGTTEKLKEQKEIHKEDILKFKTCEFCLSYVDEVYNILEIGSLDSIENDTIFHHKNLCFGCKRLFQNINSLDVDSTCYKENSDSFKLPIYYKN